MEYHWNNLVIIFHLAPCATTGLVTNWLTKTSTNVVVIEIKDKALAKRTEFCDSDVIVVM